MNLDQRVAQIAPYAAVATAVVIGFLAFGVYFQ